MALSCVFLSPSVLDAAVQGSALIPQYSLFVGQAIETAQFDEAGPHGLLWCFDNSEIEKSLERVCD